MLAVVSRERHTLFSDVIELAGAVANPTGTNNARMGVHRDAQEHEILRTVASLETNYVDQLRRPDRGLGFRVVLTVKRRRDKRKLLHGGSRCP